MNGTLFLCKNDFALFFKRNVLKFISAFTITLFAIILAIRNAVCIDDINDFFEGSGRILIGYVRGDKGLFLFSFVLLLYVSGAIIFTSLCSYNNLTLIFSIAPSCFVAYCELFDAVVILRYYSVKALPFFILNLVVAIVLLFALILYCCYIENSGYRYRYGIKELVNLFCDGVPFFVLFACIYLLKIVFVCVGCLFL